MKKKDEMGHRHLLLLTLLLPTLSFGADVQTVGRLFTSPSERAALDEMRQRHLRGMKEPDEQVAQPDNSPITVDGIVRRSSGKSTAWINQLPQNESESRYGESEQGNTARPLVTSVRLPSGAAINLKPGQSFDRSTGVVRDAYQPSREQVR